MSDTSSKNRSGWLRWILILMAVVLIAIAVAWLWLWTIRKAGLERNRQILVELETKGLGTKPSLWVDAGPAVQPALQEQYRTWETALQKEGQKPWFRAAHDVLAQRSGMTDSGKPDDLTTILEQARTDLDAAAAMLASDRLQMNGFGWLKSDIPDPDQAPFTSFVSFRTPAFIVVRAIAEGFACRALASTDPLPALADIDRLVLATDHPATILDAMSAVAVRRIRDQACLALEMEGHLPASGRERWYAAARDDLRLVADGFRGERLLLTMPLNRILVGGSLDASTRSALDGLRPEAGVLPFDLANWVHGPGDMAIALGWLMETEQACRVERAPRWRDAQDPEAREMFSHGSIVGIGVPNLGEPAITALVALNHRRIRQLASRVLVSWRERQELPADEAACALVVGAGTLASGPALCRLRYERLTPTRFRVAADPDEAPAGWPTEFIRPRIQGASTFGKPISPHPKAREAKDLSIEAEAPRP